MTIRRITVTFADADGHTRGSATGSVDRRAELIREARAKLEQFKTAARREGDPEGHAEFTMSISDAPASEVWQPKH